MMNYKAIGLCGSARSGKDTFYSITNQYLANMSIHSERISFADALKTDVKDFLLDKVGIDSFTEVNEEKELIRDFLVAYGTKLIRKVNENHWINSIQKPAMNLIDSGKVPVITDVRYANELEWVQKELNGIVIYIDRVGNPPANEEEANNDPLLREGADLKFSWLDFHGGQATKEEKASVHTLLEVCFMKHSKFGFLDE